MGILSETLHELSFVQSTIIHQNISIMRTRVYRKVRFGTKYVLAASTEKVDEKLSLWVNPIKTTARRKTLSDLWSN